MSIIKVSVFEDNDSLRNSLCFLIQHTPGFEIVSSYPDTIEVLSKLENNLPDVILMDIQMPGSNGIEAVAVIKEHFPTIQIIMQTVFDDEERIFDALCAGASGYFLKNAPPASLLSAIKEVHEGGAPMSPAVARKVLNQFRNSNTQLKADINDTALSEREREVLTLMSKGMIVKQIAEKLFISYETTRSHIKHIYEKLHVNTMTAAVAKGINQRLIAK